MLSYIIVIANLVVSQTCSLLGLLGCLLLRKPEKVEAYCMLLANYLPTHYTLIFHSVAIYL